MTAQPCRRALRRCASVVAFALVAGCGADSAVLTNWLVSTTRSSLVSWDTAACVGVSPDLTVGVEGARQPFTGGGFITGGGFDVPVCSPLQAVTSIPDAAIAGTTIDLFDGETRVARMEHETLWEPRLPALSIPDPVRVGDTVALVMSHDDLVGTAVFAFRGAGEPITVDAVRDGLTFSAVVPASAIGATTIEASLQDVRIPVDCTTALDLTCAFPIGAFFDVDPPGGAEGEGDDEQGFIALSTEVSPIEP